MARWYKVLVFLATLTQVSATVIEDSFNFTNADCPTTVGSRPTDGHERWRDCTDCRSYKYATSASGLHTRTCPSNLIWNWKLDTPNCDTISDCDECIGSCAGKLNDTGKRWRSCTSCSQYIECTSTEGMLTHTCGAGLFFNYRLDRPDCDTDESVCDSMVHICGDDCSFNIGGGVRRLADCKYCNKYMTCLGTMALNHTCNTDLGYSLERESCYNITEADCRDRTE